MLPEKQFKKLFKLKILIINHIIWIILKCLMTEVIHWSQKRILRIIKDSFKFIKLKIIYNQVKIVLIVHNS
jgi:hypothetical protein